MDRLKLHTYDYVVKKVAEHLNVADPSKIILTPYHLYSNHVKPHPIKQVDSKPLLDMLVHYNQVSLLLNLSRFSCVWSIYIFHLVNMKKVRLAV